MNYSLIWYYFENILIVVEFLIFIVDFLGWNRVNVVKSRNLRLGIN